MEPLCFEISPKSFTVDVQMGSKYATVMNCTLEMVSKCQYLSNIVKVDFKNLLLILLFLELIKNTLV